MNVFNNDFWPNWNLKFDARLGATLHPIMGELDFFALFKMHLRVSGLAIFWDIPLKWTTLGYYQMVEYQLLYTFLHLLPWPVNMVEKSKIPIFVGYVDFLQFSKCISS